MARAGATKAPPKKSGRKSGAKRAGTFTGADDPRRARGPKKGAPKAGRPPDEFKKRLAALASWDTTLAAVEAILTDASHPQFMKALEYATERGYGKVAQSVEVGGPDGGPLTVTVTRRIVRPEPAAP